LYQSYFSSVVLEQVNAKVIVAKDDPALSAALWLPPQKMIKGGPANWCGIFWYLFLVIVFFVTIKLPLTWKQYGIVAGISCGF